MGPREVPVGVRIPEKLVILVSSLVEISKKIRIPPFQKLKKVFCSMFLMECAGFF